MKKAKQFFLNAGLLAAVSILLRLLSVSFNTFVSAKIGAEGMGLFTLTMSIFGLAVTVATSGVHLAAVRLTAQALEQGEDRRPLMRGCFLYSLLFGGFAGITLFAFSTPVGVYLLSDARTVPALRLLSLSLPALSLSTALSGYFLGVRKVYKNGIISLFEQFVKMALTAALLLLFAPAGVEYACLALVAGAVVSEGLSLLLGFLLYITEKAQKETPSALPALSRVAKIALPVAWGSYARQGLLTAEHLAIPWGLKKNGASGGAALASYGVLHGMVFPLVLFPSAILSAFASLLIPEFTEAHTKGDLPHIRRMTEKVLSASLFFSLGVSGIFLGFSHEIGHAFYPGTEAGRQLSYIAPLIPVMYLDSAVDAMLKGLGEQVHCMKINIADSALSLLLVFLLLPSLGLRGYFIVLYVCELVNAALSLCRLLSVTGLRLSPLRLVAKPVLAVILATAAVRFFSAFGVPFIGFGSSPAVRIAAVFVLYLLLILLPDALRSLRRRAVR